MTELNLIPEYLRERRVRLSRLRLIIIIITLAFIIIFFAFYIPSSLIIKLQKQEAQFKLNSDLNKSNTGSGILINDDVDNLRNYINKVEKLKMNRFIISDKIYNLQQYVPEELQILNILYNHRELTVSGFTVNYISISDFVHSLQSERDFKNARITSIKYNQSNNNYSFAIKIIFPKG